MNSVSKTLYIPLYGKSYVSKKGLFLKDPKAEQIWAAEGFPLRGKSRSKWLAYYMGIRAAVFDAWVEHQMSALPDSVVLHLGCGLDSRVLRTASPTRKWYDLDFPQVIRERKRYFPESDCYRMIAADIRDAGWLTRIPETGCAIVVMEGLSMYLTEAELKTLTENLCRHFDQVVLLMDCYTGLAARLSAYRNPVKDVGVSRVYGMDDPTVLNQGTFVFAAGHSMTPEAYINTLQGMDRIIFRKIYAGSLSKKLYRLFEYKKG